MQTLIVDLPGVTPGNDHTVSNIFESLELFHQAFPEAKPKENEVDGCTILPVNLYCGFKAVLNSILEFQPDMVIIAWNKSTNDVQEIYAEQIKAFALARSIRVGFIFKDSANGEHGFGYITNDSVEFKSTNAPHTLTISEVIVKKNFETRMVRLSKPITLDKVPMGQDDEYNFGANDVNLRNLIYRDRFGNLGVMEDEDDFIQIEGKLFLNNKMFNIIEKRSTSGWVTVL